MTRTTAAGTFGGIANLRRFGTGIAPLLEGGARTPPLPAVEGDARGSADPVRDERIGHRQQRGAADQEQASVQERQAPPNRVGGRAAAKRRSRSGAHVVCWGAALSCAHLTRSVHHAEIAGGGTAAPRNVRSATMTDAT